MRTVLVEASAGRLGDDSLVEVVGCLKRGGPVALPTETVYGLAAPAMDAVACAGIFEAKCRPLSDPLICHIPSFDWLERLAETDRVSLALADKFWPGPLTLILPKSGIVPDLVTAGSSKVAVRWSAHPLFCQVIEECGFPLAAPSANRFGRLSPTSAEHVLGDLDGRIPMIVDGGSCGHGIESTIVEVLPAGIRVLRPGPISKEDLSAFGTVLQREESHPAAPGQLPSHYAPRTPLRLLDNSMQVSDSRRKGLLAWYGDTQGDWVAVERLSHSMDLREAAVNFYSALHRLDRLGCDVLYAECLPENGLGAAMMERLRKAASRE